MSSPDTIQQVLAIVQHQRRHTHNLLLVISALDGVTDMLYESVRLARLGSQRGYRRLAATLRTRHLSLIDELSITGSERTALETRIDSHLFHMLDLCQTMQEQAGKRQLHQVEAEVIAVGERLSTDIIVSLLRINDIAGVAFDGELIIVTDAHYLNAIPDIEKTCERIQQNIVPVVDKFNAVGVISGFIGGTESGEITTLGRGGSDMSASLISYCYDADELWMWSGVNGLMTADPTVISDAQIIHRLSYDEVAEMAFLGARIIHPRMIEPLRQRHIPVRIKNIFQPKQDGTLICDGDEAVDPTLSLKATTTIQGIRVTTSIEQSAAALKYFDRFIQETLSVEATLLASFRSTNRIVNYYIFPTSSGYNLHQDKQIEQQQIDHYNLTETDLELINVVTVIGHNISRNVQAQARLLQALEATGVELFVVSGSSPHTISYLLISTDVQAAIQAIHTYILNQQI